MPTNGSVNTWRAVHNHFSWFFLIESCILIPRVRKRDIMTWWCTLLKKFTNEGIKNVANPKFGNVKMDHPHWSVHFSRLVSPNDPILFLFSGGTYWESSSAIMLLILLYACIVYASANVGVEPRWDFSPDIHLPHKAVHTTCSSTKLLQYSIYMCHILWWFSQNFPCPPQPDIGPLCNYVSLS